jgi:hypothetical protein
MSNQEKQKKEKKEKKKIRIRTKDFLKPHPRLEYRTIKELYSGVSDKIKLKIDDYNEVSENLKKYGYAPKKEEFNYIKIQRLFDFGERVIDGKKRVTILGKEEKNNKKKIQVFVLSPVVGKMSALHIKNLHKLEQKLNNEFRQKNNNTKDSK